MEIRFLKPVPGVKIRDPKTKEFLPEEGRRVEMSVYWNRRIQDGTVVVVENQTAKIEKTPPDKPPKRGSDL